MPLSLFMFRRASLAKTTTLMFRVTDEEKAALKSLADSCGVSVSVLLRRMARASVSHGPEFFAEDQERIVFLTRLIRSLGNNINQIARKVNSGQCKTDPLSVKRIEELNKTIELTRLSLFKIVENAKKRRVILRAAARRSKP